jgi:hypothetical protein
MKTKLLISITLMCCACFKICAQEVLPEPHAFSTSGGVATGFSGIVGYTVGQLFYTYYAGEKGSVTEGIQQAFDIEIDTAAENTNNIQLSFMLYPNPVHEYLIVNIESEKWKNATYQLFDSQGKLLETNQMYESETFISMGNYLSSTYFLQIKQENTLVKTFKIIKN